ncbi:hypothetical protein [Wenzhouxiangella sediminis]|uniref:Uncharacterized protein n=1 Tax=Wenzhouxiangella sediminis TaxID=1792836 RepID=A0A3E1K4X2_9GAMM|nr:hypothetical protein [Wenzhouxiangella sediminis]RFF29079.1 hypothetical protein DZC52_14585 [Wenzhouxiangella sediminis]
MNESVHHIRLLAGLEIQPGESPRRTLDRHRAEQLAGHLATDLQRVVPSVDSCMLVLGASLFEPFELMRPGFPAWCALEDLAQSTLRERGFEPRILAIGSHRSQMPHEQLQPPAESPQGQFIALPMTLLCPAEQADSLKEQLEEALFERGSIDPPARALLAEAAGVDTVHGQLLTLADLVALQHVQLDSAGLGGFWPVVEQTLVEGDRDHQHELPAGLTARWDARTRRIELPFTSLDQFDGEPDDYALWLRAFRTLTTLLDSHGIAWQAHPAGPVVFDEDYSAMIESTGATGHPDGITVHHHPDIGLVAWTVVEDGRMMHIYPLRPESANRVMRDLAARGLTRFDATDQLHTDPETGRLRPAET